MRRVADDAGMDLMEKGRGSANGVVGEHEADGGECTANVGAGVGVGDAFVVECEKDGNFDSPDHHPEKLMLSCNRRE